MPRGVLQVTLSSVLYNPLTTLAQIGSPLSPARVENYTNADQTPGSSLLSLKVKAFQDTTSELLKKCAREHSV